MLCLTYDEYSGTTKPFKLQKCPQNFAEPRILWRPDWEKRTLTNKFNNFVINYDALQNYCAAEVPVYDSSAVIKSGGVHRCGTYTLAGQACCYGMTGKDCSNRSSRRWICPGEPGGSHNPLMSSGDGMVNSGVFDTFQININNSCLIPDQKSGRACAMSGTYVSLNHSNLKKNEKCVAGNREQAWAKVYHRHNASPTYCSLKLCDQDGKKSYYCVSEKDLMASSENYTIKSLNEYWSSSDAYPPL